MSFSLATDASNAINSDARGVAWLIELYFAVSGVQRFTTAPVDILAGGNNYIGYGNICTVGQITESEDNKAAQVSVSFSIVNVSMIAACIGNIERYRGKQAKIYLQLLNQHFKPVDYPVLRFAGYMDKVRIDRKRTDGGSSGSIDMVLSHPGVPRLRNNEGLRMTDAQQKKRYPGDAGLEYLQDLIEKPSLWLTKRYQAE